MTLKLWTRRLLGLLSLLLLFAAVAGVLYVWRASPQHSGSLRAAGLGAAVKIERDAHGVPSIQAQSLADLAYAVGFTHAQDRGWQLEVQRRIGQGRLAEAFGASALDTDRFLRILGVARRAQAQWATMQQHGDPEARAALLAYAAGVNAGWRSQARPPEMVALGLSFEDWTPADSLAWTLMMAWDLSTNWNQELLRLRLALQLPGAEQLARINSLMPPYPGDRFPAMDDYPALYRSLGLGAAHDAPLEKLQAAAPPSGIEGTGSNNWAVAAARSATGQPLLANDPHLKLQTPALWYLARLQAPGLKVAGVTLPGLPFITLGQNEHLAWAFTNTESDTQDLYLEELREGPDGATQARTPTGWQTLQTRRERIAVKGGRDEWLSVRSTRHGPLVSDAGTGKDLLNTRNGKRYGLALRWAALDGGADGVSINLRMNRAASVDAFLAAVAPWHSPQQNMLVAQRGGDIAYFAPASVPRRHADNRLHGLAPAPGWDAVYDWQGYVPVEALPSERAPARGWLATSNQKIHSAAYPHLISLEWALPYRQQRIEALLEAKPKHDLASLAAMQADQRSLGAEPLLPALKAARSKHPLFAQAQALLQGFDGHMDAKHAAPAVFWVWVRHLTEAVFADELGQPLFARTLATRSLRDALHHAMQAQDARWCDDTRTPALESCAQQADAALGRTLDELQASLGADPAQWRWGDLHQARAEHRPFSRVPALRPFFELSGPIGGDTYAINVARVRLTPDWTGARYTDDLGPSLRALYDLGDPTQSRAMISTGQSGLPWSPHYRDLLGPWTRVAYIPLWRAPAVQVLILRP